MTALTALAALMHDLGKATQAFQDRLKQPGLRERNHYRHEWVSVRLFQAFVGDDDDAGWLRRLAAGADADAQAQAFERQWLDTEGGRLLRDGIDEPQAGECLPFASLPPLAQAVAWLVLTHHRLPCKPVSQGSGSIGEDIDQPQYRWRRFGAHPRFVNAAELHGLLQRISADWNEPREDAPTSSVRAHWHFPGAACWPARMAQAGRTLCTQTAGAASAGGLGHGNDGPIRDARLAHVPDAGGSSLLEYRGRSAAQALPQCELSAVREHARKP